MDLWTHLKQTDKPIVLYGTGNGADKVLDELYRREIRVAGIFASSGFVRDRYFREIKVESYESVKERLGDFIVLMCFGTSRDDVLDNIHQIAAEQEFYAPDVPLYGSNLFDDEFFRQNEERISAVEVLLADEKSRLTFCNTVKNKLSGRISFLEECEVEAEEADSLISVPDGGIYVDLGAYNGDTVLRYTRMFPQISEVYAVEPDSRNFRKLSENTSHIENVHYINALISSKEGTLLVDSNKGRGVHALSSDSKGVPVPCTSIDAILKGSRADFIKFDVEGSELEALRGGVFTISEFKPQMLVSCYHRSEDIFVLVEEVLKIRPDYKVYMRHLKSVPGWETQFYFM